MNDEPKHGHPNCAAHACPCLGTMTRSTTGTDKWFCGYHFTADPSRWGQVTDELNRLVWLVKMVRWLRAGAPSAEWGEHKQALVLNQSKHLACGPQESQAQWLRRLEGTLYESCRERQQPLQGDENAHE